MIAIQPLGSRRVEIWRTMCGNVELVKCCMTRSDAKRLKEWFELKIGNNTTRLSAFVSFRYIADAALQSFG